MIFFSEESLEKAVKEYLAHYHTERNHQGIKNQLIETPEDDLAVCSSTTTVQLCRERCVCFRGSRKDGS